MARHELDTLDLTDEEGLLTVDRVEHDPAGVRARLWALNLKSTAPSTGRDAEVVDMAVFQATGDSHLASLFSSAA